MKRGEFSCVVCNITFGMPQVYISGHFAFCSEKCHTKYQELPKEKQKKLDRKLDQKADRHIYPQATL